MAFARFRLPLFGLLSGALLSAMRAPLGLDWTQLAVVDGSAAALFRAAALVAIALCLDARRPAFRSGTRPLVLLPAISAGFLLHGLFLALPFQPGCRLGIGIGFLSATLLLWLLAGRVRTGEAAEVQGEWSRPLPRGERLGLLLAGMGAALAIESVAQHVRLLGQGLSQDDTVIGGFLLVWVTLMTLCFGFTIRPSAGKHGVLSTCSLALAAALGVYGLKFLGGLDRDGLWQFLKGVPFFELDTSRVATLPADLWISATSMVPIGMALGIAVLGARHPGRLAAMLLGAALGLLLRPYAIEALNQPLPFPEGGGSTWAWQLVALGAALAGVGSMLAARSLRGTRRLLASLFGLAAASAPLVLGMLSPVVVWSFSPWLIHDVYPELVIPSSVGVISVEPRPSGEQQVNVDRRRITPSAQEQGVDELRLRYSLALMDPERLASGALRVLFLGQLTPERDSMLRLMGVSHLDRSASWYAAMPAIEARLFGQGRQPLGKRISPAQARARIRQGDYDLIIALTAGAPDVSPRGAKGLSYSSAEAPIFGALKVPEGSVGVVWVDGSAALHTRSLGGRLILAMDHLEQLSVGVVLGELSPESAASRPLLFESGAPLWPASIGMETLERLMTRVPERVFGARESLLKRLAQAPTDGPSKLLARGLERHFALQERSSPFENPAYAIEWDEEVLGDLFGALGSLETLDPFSRSLAEDLYWLLTEKRLADLLIVYGEALAEKHAPWPAADRALAQAYKELLEPIESLRFWKRVLVANPNSIEDHMRCADAAIEAEQPQDAVRILQQALKIQPQRFDLRRGLGLALQLTGDPAGEALLQALLEQAPEDNLIRGALGMDLIPELEDDHGEH